MIGILARFNFPKQCVRCSAVLGKAALIRKTDGHNYSSIANVTSTSQFVLSGAYRKEEPDSSQQSVGR